MKATRIIVSLILIISMLSTVVYAVDSTDSPWVTTATNGTATVSEDGKDITLACSTSKKTRATTEAVSPAIEGAREGFDINLSFNLTLSNFDANRQASVVLQSPAAEYNLSLLTFNGSVGGASIKLFDGTVCDCVIENDTPTAFNAAFNIKTGAVKISVDGDVVYNDISELISYLDMDDLKVSLKNIFSASLLGNSCVQFTDFSFTPGLYIELSSDSLQYKQGQTARINVTLPNAGWNKVDFYDNGVYAGKIIYGEERYFDFVPKGVGSIELKAVVSDSAGNSAETSIDLFYARNELPSVSFDGLSDGQQVTFGVEEQKILALNASDEDGYIERIEIYRFGELAKVLYGEPWSVDIDEIGITLGNNPIKAVAYDDFGGSSAVSVSAMIVKYTSSQLFNESEFVSSGSSYGSGMNFMHQRGHVTERIIDDEYGTSMILGMDETCDTENFTDGQYSFAQGSINLKYKQQLIEFDMCITRQPERNACVKFGIRKSNALVQDIMYVDKDGLSFENGDKYSIDTGWHHVAVTLSFKSDSTYYSVAVDGENVVNRAPADFVAQPTHFRFFTTTDPADIGEVAFDNIQIFSKVESPSIIGVGSHDEIIEGALDGNNRELGIFLSGSVNRDDINSESVKIFAGNNVLDTDLIRFNSDSNCIEVTMSDKFVPNNEYRIVLGENIRFEAENTFGLPSEYHFTTSDEGFTVKNVTLERNGENINITLKAVNLEDSEKDIYVFVSIFDTDGRLCKTKLFKETLPSDYTDNTFTFTVEAEDGMKPYVFTADAIKMTRIYYAKAFAPEDITVSED